MQEKYSGKQVIKAGESFLSDEIYRDRNLFNESMNVLSYWRFQHETPLEQALSLLEKETLNYDRSAIFAKRLKRHPSIVSKLKRFPQMKLKNMQDIGGCRAIVSTEKKLQQITRELRKREEFRNSNGDIRFKDYIKNPKDDGYRGYHLIGTFKDDSSNNKLIEIQLRTTIQHDWATALEIIDLFTGQALKSNKGREDWKEFFRLVSLHFEIMESIHLFSVKNPEEQFFQYQQKVINDTNLFATSGKVHAIESKLGVVKNLEAFAHSLRIANQHISDQKVSGYVLLRIDTRKSTVETTLFNEQENDAAEKTYLKYEKDASNSTDIVVALVSTTAVGGIREAYPNYFADSSDFLKYLIHILKLQQIRRKPSFFEKILNQSGL